jgi:hypothetical protein
VKILIFLTITNLCLITYQDFKYRAVSWILFAMLAILCICLHLLFNQSWEDFGRQALINNIFLLIQVSIAFVLLFFKNNRKKVDMKSKIGLGDILFLIAVSFLLPFMVFAIYYLGSLVFSLLIYFFILRRSQEPVNKTIPLAGLQAIFLAICIIFSFILPDYILDMEWSYAINGI